MCIRDRDYTALSLRHAILDLLCDPGLQTRAWVAACDQDAVSLTNLRETLRANAARFEDRTLHEWEQAMRSQNEFGDANMLIGAALKLRRRIHILSTADGVVTVRAPDIFGAEYQPIGDDPTLKLLTLNTLTLILLSLIPLTLNPLTLNPLTLNPLTLNQLALNPLTLNPLGDDLWLALHSDHHYFSTTLQLPTESPYQRPQTHQLNEPTDEPQRRAGADQTRDERVAELEQITSTCVTSCGKLFKHWNNDQYKAVCSAFQFNALKGTLGNAMQRPVSYTHLTLPTKA